MLSKKQSEILKIVTENARKGFIHLHEIPTGFCKSTYLLPYSAAELSKDKKIIISTFTNSLADKLFLNFKEKFPHLNCGIVIGAENYLDLNKIDEEFYTYFTFPDKVIEYIKTLNKNITFEELFRDCLLNDDDKLIVSDLYHADNRKDLDDVSEYDISITNHVFLLLLRYNQSIDLSQYYILADEVDKMSDAQKLISISSFSISRFKTSLKKIISKSKIDKATKKYLGKIYKESSILLKKYKDEDKIDAYITEKKFFRDYLDDLSDFVSSRKKLTKIVKELKGDKYAKIFLKEYDELNTIINSEGNISLYYSPAKGYPTVHFQRQNVQLGLYNFFKSLSGFIGVSGTLFNVPIVKDNKEFRRVKDTSKNMNDYIIDKLGFAGLRDKVEIKNEERIFPIDGIKIKIDIIKKNKNNTDDETPDTEWIQKLAIYIKNTFENKNSLVILGSYAEVKALYLELAKLLPNTNIIKADYTMTQAQTINKFKSEGGILIGTRSYATGIDLPGKELEKLYIVKLLFPPINDKDMQDKKAFNTGYYWKTVYNDMLFITRQSLGRLQRRPDDKGDIYILDERVNDEKIKDKLERIFKSVGKLI